MKFAHDLSVELRVDGVDNDTNCTDESAFEEDFDPAAGGPMTFGRFCAAFGTDSKVRQGNRFNQC